MKQFLFLVRFYLTFLFLFVLAKLCFVLTQSADVRGDISLFDVVRALYHGLSLDLATTTYASLAVWFLTGISLWLRVWKIETLYKVYAACTALTFSLIVVADCCLYDFWRFKIDGTIFNYLDEPQGIIESISILYLITAAGAIAVVTYAVYQLLTYRFPTHLLPTNHRIFWTTLWVFIGGIMFLGIRGGVGKSCTNVGQVYFSHNQFLNHTAVNPCFSIMASASKIRQFDEDFNFYPEKERNSIFESLGYNTQSIDTELLLKTRRPNVLVILMEGCGGTFVHAVDTLADPGITPNLNRLAREGIVFTQCYANSFRTDRGMVCAFSGYPSFPDVSVMKVPSLCHKLPSIAHSLRTAGYSTAFMYGGDINFTNTKGYLLATGYEETFSKDDFASDLRKTHEWGVTDHIVLDSLYQHLQRFPKEQPWHMGILTLSSHEPWIVPYNRIPNDKFANGMAYLDNSLGHFVRKLKQSPVWDNTLVVILPDHGIQYPQNIHPQDERKTHIPMIWTGGAIQAPRQIDTLCNQSDLAATLLGQLGIAHDEFYFSRDILSSTYTHPSAVHTWPEGIYYKDNTGISIVNLMQSPTGIFRESPTPSPFRVKAAKIILQTCYDKL